MHMCVWVGLLISNDTWLPGHVGPCLVTCCLNLPFEGETVCVTNVAGYIFQVGCPVFSSETLQKRMPFDGTSHASAFHEDRWRIRRHVLYIVESGVGTAAFWKKNHLLRLSWFLPTSHAKVRPIRMSSPGQEENAKRFCGTCGLMLADSPSFTITQSHTRVFRELFRNSLGTAYIFFAMFPCALSSELRKLKALPSQRASWMVRGLISRATLILLDALQLDSIAALLCLCWSIPLSKRSEGLDSWATGDSSWFVMTFHLWNFRDWSATWCARP